MKKSLLALAVLGAFAGAASAQSTVTLFGVVDAQARSINNDGPGRLTGLGGSGLNSNRFGFRGTEDLGGGMTAGFWLEQGFNPDDGTFAVAARQFHRRATVSLIGGFGELRLGRDYTPSFWNTTIFDPFGTNGVGNVLNVSNASGSNGAPAALGIGTYVRANNTVGYFLPGNLGGLYGQVMVAAGEGGPNKYVGGRIGWASGPIDVAAHYGRTDTVAGGSQRFKAIGIGGSYNLGVAKIMAQYNSDKNDRGPAVDFEEKWWEIGATVPMGQGEIRAAYVKNAVTGTAAESPNDVTQIALGYIYNLSRRTAMYGTASRLDNKGTGQLFIPGGPATITAGGKSTGYEVGLRHSF